MRLFCVNVCVCVKSVAYCCWVYGCLCSVVVLRIVTNCNLYVWPALGSIVSAAYPETRLMGALHVFLFLQAQAIGRLTQPGSDILACCFQNFDLTETAMLVWLPDYNPGPTIYPIQSTMNEIEIRLQCFFFSFLNIGILMIHQPFQHLFKVNLNCRLTSNME